MKFVPLKDLKDYGGTKLILGKDLKSGKYLVEKKLVIQNEIYTQFFENEKKYLLALKHRNIVKYFGEGETPLSFYIEYAFYNDLISYFKKIPNARYKLLFIREILSVLMYLHNNGIVHNDLNPSNILVFQNNRVKLSDFAFAGVIGEPAFPDRPMSIGLGTSGYVKDMNFKKHSVVNDIYGFGKTLYEVLTERFKSKEVDLDLIPKYAEVVQKCLEVKYNSIKEVYKDIENITEFFSVL